jgi:N-methylhydantoinase B/oxoprolinase/acetone carboxylase alpha subunit
MRHTAECASNGIAYCVIFVRTCLLLQQQVQHWTLDGLSPGDVLVSNHPQLAGGSHLPDITVITPVFVDGHKHPQFFVASRYTFYNKPLLICARK